MRFFKRFKRGQHGFTLVELMVVMAIIAVLAAIVIPPVTGTKQVSSDSQVKQDASAVSTAVSAFNADQNLAQNTSTVPSATVVGETSTNQTTSNKWPEQAISAAYTTEFLSVTTIVSSVTIKAKDGTTMYATGAGTASLDDFVFAYNALNLSTLTTGGYLQQQPNGADTKFSTSKLYHNYLWLVKKVKVDTDATAGRVVEVYSLITITTATEGDELIYQRVY